MKLGINTVLFGSADLETALRGAKLAGFDNVELAAIAGMTEHLKIGDDVARIKDLLAANELTATAIEAATTDKSRLADLFKLAKSLGIDIVNIGSGGTSGDEESTVAAVQLMRELAELAGDTGVTLAVKPHVGQAIYNADTGLRLAQEVTTGRWGLNFDPSHLARADENPALVAPRWGSRIVTSHFRDCPVTVPGPPGTPQQQIPGNGALDLTGILASLQGTGYAGNVNLEVIGAKEFPFEQSLGLAGQARGFLKRCFAEIEKN